MSVFREAKFLGTKGENLCVIRCPAISHIARERILEKLGAEGVIGLEARGTRGIFVLNFSEPPPKIMKVGCLKVRTQRYIPRNVWCRRCFTCHDPLADCINTTACRRCGNEHVGVCPKRKNCWSCGGPHLPTCGWCPVWHQERKRNETVEQYNPAGGTPEPEAGPSQTNRLAKKEKKNQAKKRLATQEEENDPPIRPMEMVVQTHKEKKRMRYS